MSDRGHFSSLQTDCNKFQILQAALTTKLSNLFQIKKEVTLLMAELDCMNHLKWALETQAPCNLLLAGMLPPLQLQGAQMIAPMLIDKLKTPGYYPDHSSQLYSSFVQKSVTQVTHLHSSFVHSPSTPVIHPLRLLHQSSEQQTEMLQNEARKREAAAEDDFLRRRGLWAEKYPKFLPPDPPRSENYEQRRERARVIAAQEHQELVRLYAELQLRNVILAPVERLRFAEILAPFQLFGQPALCFLFLNGSNDCTLCILDTRIGATSCASYLRFRDQPNTRVLDETNYLHYPFLHKDLEVATCDAKTTFYLSFKHFQLPITVALTQSWLEELVVIAVDDLAPYIYNPNMVSQTFEIKYAEGVNELVEFSWITDNLMKSFKMRDQSAAYHLFEKNKDAQLARQLFHRPIQLELSRHFVQ